MDSDRSFESDAFDDDSVSPIVLEYEAAWSEGPPPLDRFRSRFAPEDSVQGLSQLVKTDLKQRFLRGERPTARSYLDRYPELAQSPTRALSLIYEEYCLCVDAKVDLSPSEFCGRYESWRDSLESQLFYHHQLSRAVVKQPAALFPEVGERFGDYRLLRILGEGGAARVFLAAATNLSDKQFVLKVSLDRGREPSILGKLDHEHIVPVLSSIVDPVTGLRGLCMPYRPGLPLNVIAGSLRRAKLPASAEALRAFVVGLAPSRPGDDAECRGWVGFPQSGTFADGVAWLGMKLARALAHAHAAGYFHRDVKPDNILLTERDGPQLFDFNLAHDSNLVDQAHEAHRGGTLPYMAREHLDAFLDASKWADVGVPADLFSLALILRELLTGKPPTKPDGSLKLPNAINELRLLRAAPLKSIRLSNPRVPQRLADIIDKCLAEAPEDRFVSASRFADELGLYLKDRGRTRRRRALVGSAVIVSILSVCSGFFLPGEGTPRIQPTRQTLDLLRFASRCEAEGARSALKEAIQESLNHPDLLPALEIITKEFPDSTTLPVTLANKLVEAGRIDDSKRIYTRLIEAHPRLQSAIHGLANIKLAEDDLSSAYDLFAKALILAESNSDPEAANHIDTYKSNLLRIAFKLGDRALDEKDFPHATFEFHRGLAQVGERYPAARRRRSAPADVWNYEQWSAMMKLGLAKAEHGLNRPSMRYATEARVHIETAKKLAASLERKFSEYSTTAEKSILDFIHASEK